MKKQSAPILMLITIAFAAFTIGFFLGRNQKTDAVSVSVPVSMQTTPPVTTIPQAVPAETAPIVSFPININTASEEEFMALPGIGEVLTQRILTYREEHGSFSAVEELLNVEGIGQKRLEEMLELITIGG